MECWSEAEVIEWVAREFNEETVKEFEGLSLRYTNS